MLKQRILYKSLEAHLDSKEFTILTGARQTGKTSLLRLLYNTLLSKGRKAFWFTLDDAELLQSLDQRPENIFNITGMPKSVMFSEDVSPEDRLYILIDEVQYLKNPTNFLKLLYDKFNPALKLIVTGSSAFYIDRKFTDSLVGRKRLFWLKTLDFDEFLHFRDADNLRDELARLRTDPTAMSVKMAELRVYFNEYLIYGGYPAVVLQNDQKEKEYLLNEIKNSYIKRDIHESNIGHEIAFMNLMRLLAGQCGSLINRNELAATLRIDNKTVENYLYVMQKCFHIELLRPYFNNTRKEITKMPKVYFYDTGLRNALLNRFDTIANRDDKGQIVENYVFRRFTDMYDTHQIQFWRTADGHEVDFLINEQYPKGKAYEVKFNAEGVNPKKYELFTKSVPDFPLSFISFVPHDGSIDAMRY